MANAILYNQGSHPTGALKSGTMSMNVSPSLNIGSLKWRNGFENNNMWVIYSDTYSQGQATQGNALPTIWATSTFTDAGLVGLINSLPARAGQTPFTNVTAATSWLRGQGVYFLSNQNYPQIVTSGLTIMLDAGFPASFPTGTGTTWYDVSGNDYVGNMVNGPSWTNSGTTSYINFDGSDDYVLVSNNANILSKTSYTKIAWFNASTFSTNNNIISGGNNGAHAFWLAGGNRLNAGHNGGWSTVQSTSTLSLNTWYYGAVTFDTTNGWKLYLNGIQESTSNSTTTFDGNGEILIGAYGNASNLFTGKITNSMVYNRVLSQSEILQNYYNGPIVTSGLTLALDAGNLVSYGGTGTSWKDLNGNNNFTLINGVSYDALDSGCLSFDGTNDIATGTVPTLNTGGGQYNTVTFWMYLRGSNGGFPFELGGYRLWVPGNNFGFNTGNSDIYGIPSSQLIDKWVHVGAVFYNGEYTNNNKLYINGTLQTLTQRTGSASAGSAGTGIAIGGYQGDYTSYPFYGKIGPMQMYAGELTQLQVQQNYNAQRGRFGI